jgi:hypothetical protein
MRSVLASLPPGSRFVEEGDDVSEQSFHLHPNPSLTFPSRSSSPKTCHASSSNPIPFRLAPTLSSTCCSWLLLYMLQLAHTQPQLQRRPSALRPSSAGPATSSSAAAAARLWRRVSGNFSLFQLIFIIVYIARTGRSVRRRRGGRGSRHASLGAKAPPLVFFPLGRLPWIPLSNE